MKTALIALAVVCMAAGLAQASTCGPQLNNGRCPTDDTNDCLYPWGGANVCKNVFANCIGTAMSGAKAKVQRCPHGQVFNVYSRACSTDCSKPTTGLGCTALVNGLCPTDDNHNCLYPVAGNTSQFANCQGISMANVAPIVQDCSPDTPTFAFSDQNCI